MEHNIEKYWEQHRHQIYHYAEQWEIAVLLALVESQHGAGAAIDLFLEEARRQGMGVKA